MSADVSEKCIKDIIDFLRGYLPPDPDFAVSLYETPSATYYLSRDGIFISQRRIEEHLPFLKIVHRKISPENIPVSILRSIDLCEVLKGVIEENIRWLNLGSKNHSYYDIARSIVSDKDTLLRLFKCL
jgi:hypothetical protein